ncbi:MAG TPA: single-stranded DNA-binding protein [Clostridiales bacterium]|nr:single-stranded DNA-binding protein [Clostridiales bacterium]
MLNLVCIVGNLTKDLELRYTSSGKAVVSMGIACNRSYKVGDEYREEVLFINIIVWGKRAENCVNQLHKGDPIFVEGRLQSRNWETKDGQKRTTIEIVADDIQFLNRAKKGTSPENEAHKDDAMQGFEVEEPEI